MSADPKCFVCKKRALVWCGNYRIGRKMMIKGWCSGACLEKGAMDDEGVRQVM